MQTPPIAESYPDGSTVERPMTADEAAQYEKDQAEAAADQAAAEAAAATAAANAADAIAHAKSLGFTDAMISAMYPGLAQ
jgi:hypothetical protein